MESGRERDTVSLWVGSAESRERLVAYCESKYTPDGDRVPSEFERDFGITYVDEDFQETISQAATTLQLRELLKGCSYDTKIIPAFAKLIGDFLVTPANAAILLYEFRFAGPCVGVDHGSVIMQFQGCISRER